MTEKRQAELKQKAAQINDRMVRASQALKQVEQLEKQKKQMMVKANISAELMEPVPRSLLLATVTNALPTGVSLVDYKMTCKEIKPTATASTSKSRSKKSRTRQKAPTEEKAPTLSKVETEIE